MFSDSFAKFRLAEPYLVAGMPEITDYRDWRCDLRARKHIHSQLFSVSGYRRCSSRFPRIMNITTQTSARPWISYQNSITTITAAMIARMIITILR
jgi:hypothetical protein